MEGKHDSYEGFAVSLKDDYQVRETGNELNADFRPSIPPCPS